MYLCVQFTGWAFFFFFHGAFCDFSYNVIVCTKEPEENKPDKKRFEGKKKSAKKHFTVSATKASEFMWDSVFHTKAILDFMLINKSLHG